MSRKIFSAVEVTGKSSFRIWKRRQSACPDQLSADEKSGDDEVIRQVLERIVNLLNGDVKVET